MTNDEFIAAMQEIINTCPSFYHAYFDLGVRLLASDIDKATETLDTGFEISIQISPWDIIEEEFAEFFNNLEMKMRPEFILRYALKLIEKFPEKARLYDYAANGFIELNHYEKAIEHGTKAIEMAPENSHFLNNLGMYYLTEKQYYQAEKYFNLSIKADPENENPVYNLANCKIMRAGNLSLSELYLQPANYKKIEKYENKEEWEELDEYVAILNHSKFIIFEETLAEKNQFKAHNYPSQIGTLKVFFGFVKSISQSTFVWENINFLTMNYKAIIHKFIFKHGDVDDEILSEIHDSSLMFYSFLADNKVIKKKQFEEFKDLADSLKEELFDKMHKYNKIRHDSTVSESKKEKIREKLFEGDHSWMFID